MQTVWSPTREKNQSVQVETKINTESVMASVPIPYLSRAKREPFFTISPIYLVYFLPAHRCWSRTISTIWHTHRAKLTRLGFVLVQSSVGFLPYHIELTPNPFKLMRNEAWNAASLCPLPANLQPNPARVVVTRVSFLWAMLRNISIITTFLCYSSLTSSITE